MQDIREELSQFNATVHELIACSKSVVPLKQRRQTLRQPTAVTATCTHKKMEMSMVPGAIFTILPPNQEAIDAAEKLKRQYERCIAL